MDCRAILGISVAAEAESHLYIMPRGEKYDLKAPFQSIPGRHGKLKKWL